MRRHREIEPGRSRATFVIVGDGWSLAGLPVPDPTFALLLAVARHRPDVARARRAIAAGVDWDRFAELARLHRVSPLASRGLGLVAAVPAGDHPGLAKLARVTARVARRSLMMARETMLLVRALNEAGIDVLVLKGTVEGAASWDAIALRTAGDIDLYVAPAQAQQAVAVLRAQGLEPVEPLVLEAVGSAWVNPAEAVFRDRSKGSVVELHWRFGNPGALFPLDLPPMLARAVVVPVASVGIPTLPFPERFLFLCTHGGKHGWTQLAWLCDIAANLRRMTAADAQIVAQRAVALGIVRPLAVACHMAAGLLDAAIPAGLPALDPPARWLLRRCVAPLLADPERHAGRGSRGPWRILADNLVFSTRWRTRAAVLATILMPGKVDCTAGAGSSPALLMARRLLRLLRHGPKPAAE
ncbi:MAG: nucleotidyltransferase family protein [Azospirillaceae bacterium]|nr:nucleotidyltransferase family protein [Azospirillaceae bacterium]